ncbi:hypothetical protein Q0601_07585, partial [Paracoccus onubensis]|uniref:hypothetical protein n=1 Tax=Paracoccus onubensis TaxID=1675788 RepID=UPI002730BA07
MTNTSQTTIANVYWLTNDGFFKVCSRLIDTAISLILRFATASCGAIWMQANSSDATNVTGVNSARCGDRGATPGAAGPPRAAGAREAGGALLGSAPMAGQG